MILPFASFICQLPIEDYIDEDLQIKRSKYPIECYILKSGNTIKKVKAYTDVITYTASQEGDIIDIFKYDD